MKIGLVTPLYPPDVAEPAPFVKELARRLSKEHSVTVLAYGATPEALDGVHVEIIRKQLPKFLRIGIGTFRISQLLSANDVVLLENGPSVEVPAAIALLFSSKRTLLHIGDARASARLSQSRLLSFIHTRLRARCGVIETTPPPKPELLPLDPYPTDAMAKYEEKWNELLAGLETRYAH